MRASTLLGLALALIIGLVVVAGIRYSGYFTRAPEAAAVKKEPVMVLAASHNLYQGTSSTSLDVGARPATEAELKFMRDNPDKVMPAIPEAAHLRKLKRNAPVNEMLLRDHFEAMDLPPAIVARLAPGMRAVDLELPKDRAAAGLLRLDEHVDVYLTSTVCTDAAGSQPRTAIAAIAKDLKIVVKRDILYTLLLPVPEDKPVGYILEANPYRAALIEFSKSRGNITLVATSGQNKDHNGAAGREQELVDRFVKGEASVTESDLEKIFRLPPLPSVPQPLTVTTYNGNQVSNVTVIQSPVPGNAERFEGSYRFFIPSASSQLAKLENGKKDAPANNVSVKSVPPNKKK